MKNKRMWIYGTLVILLAATCFGAGLLDKNDQNMFGKWSFFNSIWLKGGSPIVLEGATENGYETTIAITDPTSDNTITVPAAITGAIMVSSLTTNAPDIANSVTGGSNGLVFEGATANTYETTITPTDPTADRTVTLQDASGTVALTSQNVDMTITPVTDGGNAGAKNEYIGLPSIKLVGGTTGTNPASQTIPLIDDTPDGEWAEVDAGTNVVITADTTYYKCGSKSLKMALAATAVAGDGVKDAGLGAAAAWDDMESAGLFIYTDTALTAGDLTLVLTDDGGARTYNIPAVATTSAWTWVEIDISSGDLSAVSDVAILLSSGGATNLAACNVYFDIGYVWDAVDEEAMGVAIQQDGVLSVINTVTGAPLAELTDYIVHYESGNDFIVYITDQSAAGVLALVAY